MFLLSKIRTVATVLPLRASKQIVPVRHGGQWVYRRLAPPASRKTLIKAEVMGFLLWTWILWHLWHEPYHIIGHHPFPDPSKWSDVELGIPEDDDTLGLIGEGVE